MTRDFQPGEMVTFSNHTNFPVYCTTPDHKLFVIVKNQVGFVVEHREHLVSVLFQEGVGWVSHRMLSSTGEVRR